MHVLEMNMCYHDVRDVSQTPVRCNLQHGTIKQRIVRSVIIAQNGVSLRRQGNYFYYTSTPTRVTYHVSGVTCHVSHPLHFIAITFRVSDCVIAHQAQAWCVELVKVTCIKVIESV